MHRHDIDPQREDLVTWEQFNKLRKEMTADIVHLRAILEVQHKQIDLLTLSRQKSAREMEQCQRKNQEIMIQNQILKLKIASLQTRLLVLTDNVNTLKNQIQISNNFSFEILDTQLPIIQLDNIQNIMQEISLQKVEDDPCQKQSENVSGSKYLIQNRKTNDNQEFINEDQEEEIPCVWNVSSSKNIPENDDRYRHNPHNLQFTTQKRSDYLYIIKNSGSGYFSPSHSFIHKDKIPLQKVSKYSVRRMKVRDIFLIGIGTVQILGVQNAFRHRQIAAYSSNGYVWLNGDSSKCSKSLEQNQTCDMFVDRINETISWFIDDTMVHKSYLPVQMLGKQVYLVIMLFNKGDNVHLMC